MESALFFFFPQLPAYTGYRRSIDGVLEAGNKSNANEPPHSSDVDVENHTLTTTAVITQNTSSAQDQTKGEQAPPQPAPRTRLSSQNSVPMTNGDSAKSDDASQVRVFVLAS
jgi:hypothetical protein